VFRLQGKYAFGNIEIVTNILAQFKLFSDFTEERLLQNKILEMLVPLRCLSSVLMRAKYLNSFNKQCLAVYLILYRGNFSQCSRVFNFP